MRGELAADEIEGSDDSSVEDLEAPSRKRKAPQTALKVRVPCCLHHWGLSQVHRRHLCAPQCLTLHIDTLQGCVSHPALVNHTKNKRMPSSSVQLKRAKHAAPAQKMPAAQMSSAAGSAGAGMLIDSDSDDGKHAQPVATARFGSRRLGTAGALGLRIFADHKSM